MRKNLKQFPPLGDSLRFSLNYFLMHLTFCISALQVPPFPPSRIFQNLKSFPMQPSLCIRKAGPSCLSTQGPSFLRPAMGSAAWGRIMRFYPFFPTRPWPYVPRFAEARVSFSPRSPPYARRVCDTRLFSQPLKPGNILSDLADPLFSCDST